MADDEFALQRRVQTLFDAMEVPEGYELITRGGREDFEADMHAWYELHPPIQLPSAEELEKMIADDPSMITRGQEVFGVRCVSCHASDGGGLVGPNLTDNFSIHGQSLDKMVRVVYEGVPAKGMLAWKSQLPPEDIFAVTAFAHSLRGTTPAKPRDPQGDPIEEPVASAN